MKLPINPRLPNSDDVGQLKQALTQALREIAAQVNAISEGQLQGTYNAQAAPPAQGAYQTGDFIRNAAPAVAGAAGAQYLIVGWYCVAGGSPGTWAASRTLTGT